MSYRENLANLLSLYPALHVASKRYGRLITLYSTRTRAYRVYDLMTGSFVTAETTDRRECEIYCKIGSDRGDRPSESMTGFRTYPVGIFY